MKCCLIGSDHNHCFHLISSPQLKFCIIIASKISFGQCRTSPQPPSSQTLGCPNANVSPPECIIWKLLHNKTSLDWVQSQSLHCWKSGRSAHPYSDVGSRRTSHHPTLSLGSQATEIEKEIWNIVWANINSILQQSALPLILQSFCWTDCYWISYWNSITMITLIILYCSTIWITCWKITWSVSPIVHLYMIMFDTILGMVYTANILPIKSSQQNS